MNEKYKSIIDTFQNLSLEEKTEVMALLTDNMNSVYKKQLFLKGKSNATFSLVNESPDGSFYKLSNVKDNVGEFEYIGTLENAAAQFNAIFDNVAKVNGSAFRASGYKIIQKGIVEKLNDKWIVKQPVIIEFTR